MLFYHWLQDSQLAGFWVILDNQVKAWSKESVDVHDSLNEFSIDLVFKRQVVRAFWASIDLFYFLVNRELTLLNILLKVDNAFVYSL